MNKTTRLTENSLDEIKYVNSNFFTTLIVGNGRQQKD